MQEQHEQLSNANGQSSLPTRFTNPNSIDNWRHTRMLEAVTPFIKSNPSYNWLTVGDGNYGSDAAYLESLGATVIASSLNTEKLKKSYDLGYIKRYQKENAEYISLKDNEVDYCLCKESYHHFPRPTIALYEMLRVSCQAVVLIEPLDNIRIFDALKKCVKKLIRGDKYFEFEPSGNYIYKPSFNEIYKLSSAIFLEVIAIKKMNDFYHPKFGSHSKDKISFPLFITNIGILIQNILCKFNLLGYGIGIFVVFKNTPSDELINNLKKNNFKIIYLPKNPYL